MSKTFVNGDRIIVQGPRDIKPYKATIRGRPGVSTYIVEWIEFPPYEKEWDCSEVYEGIISEDPDYRNFLDKYEV